MNLWSLDLDPETTKVTSYFNKERLEVFKGSDHSDLSLSLSPIGLPSPSQIF
jgi:hypothetical protein